MYDITKIRSQFLGLSKKDDKGQLPLLFDGPGGSQLPKRVVDAMMDYLYHFNSNMGGHAQAGQITQAINHQARQAVGTWLNAPYRQIIFGLNATSLMFHVSRTLSQAWQAGDNIILSSLDHFSHVSSWQSAAKDKGVVVKMLPLTACGTMLDLSALDELIDERTRLIAVSLASNVLGSKTDISPIITKARQVGAIVSVDAVHAIVHDYIDTNALDCDILFASAYKIGAARLGICYMKPDLTHFSPLYKVEPASNSRPFAWETGTQSFEAQQGIIALLDYWLSLSNHSQLCQDNLKQSYDLVKAHETKLGNLFLMHAKNRPYFRLYGKDGMEGRTPTFAFNVVKNDKIITPNLISQWLGEYNIALPAGNFYALGVVQALGLENINFLRAGFLHYNQPQEIEILFDKLDEFVANYQR